MEKMKMESPDLTQRNIEAIGALFPNCVTEARGEDGRLRRAVNFDMLRQMLTDEAIAGDEAYEFTWVGKKAAMVEASRPIRKTLRPCKAESVNWDTTENLYIEGDNLDVLKLLQESYLGRVKMIYIDPPYNTGHDFIYRDSFARSKSEEEQQMGMFDEETEEQLFENTESNGRFHSDWCSMIYPRLMLARNILSEDGVLFVSIDDNEVRNMRLCCDEVFGENNFVVQIIWKKRSTPPNDQIIGAAHEYILVYAKNFDNMSLNLRARSEEETSRYKNPDNHPKGPWVAGDLSANVKGGRYVASLNYPIVNPNTGEAHYPPNNGNWRYSQETMAQLLDNNEIFFGEDGRGRPKLKRFLCNVKDGITYTSLWDFVPFNTQGSKEMIDIMGGIAIFDNPKPTGLILELLRLGSSANSIVLDFFSGSATTAHAVMQLNAEDGGHRKFIMVQLPEKCDESSEAYKAGYRTICDIGKERIRRAGEKVRAEAGLMAQDLDVGFRVLKLDESNMKDVYYSASTWTQAMLESTESNIKEDRSDLDLLYGCLLDWALLLSLPCCVETIDGCTVHTYGSADPTEEEVDLKACFDANVPESVVRAMAARKPRRVVFRDSSFASSPGRINVEEIFKLLAPNTSVRVI